MFGLREGRFSYRAKGACVQRNCDANLEAVDRGTPHNWKNWQWKMKSDDRHHIRMAVNDRASSSRKLISGVLMSDSPICRRLLPCGGRARVPFYWIPLMANHRRLHLQWALGHRAWQAD
ncbi:hypothetical protein TNCV_1477641 [Trichonephila clavipes]|nr:hypothetical protein TNCV_1477641 [Trichonephila clavipes]